MEYLCPFLGFVSDGLKWPIKHLGYATNVRSEIQKLEREMGKLEDVYNDVDDKVAVARTRFLRVKEQVDGWQGRVQEFKARVDVDFQLPLNCSCNVHCPNCWTRYQVGKRVVVEHGEEAGRLIAEGAVYSDGTVVDPDHPSPIEMNIKSIQEEAKRLWDVEVDINSRVEATKREHWLLPKRQIEGWIQRVSEHKKDVSAIQNDFEEMENSDNRTQFSKKVGGVILASDCRIEQLAEQICDYCGGLPLALELIGTAMRGKHNLFEWSVAKNALHKYAPGFEDGELVKLFSSLRLSYNSLKNDIMRECFCYCALFRADWSIRTSDLVWCWIGEGLFDNECDNIDAALDKGYTVIRELIKAGLLKEVKDGKDELSQILKRMNNDWEVAMHDVLRDMALRIKNDEFKISKGRSGFGEISGKEARLGLTAFGEDESMERDFLAQFGKSAPKLSTLITARECVTLLGDDVLEAMNKLRVLHTYGRYGYPLRLSIGRLRDLRCLNLYNFTVESLEVLAELGSLRLLIMDAPYMGKFSFEGVISRLSKLQVLILRGNHLFTGVESIGVSISELKSLPCLEDLQLIISTTSFLKGLANSPTLAGCVSHITITKMGIRCFQLIQKVGSMDRLKILRIDRGSELREVVIEEEQGCKPDTLRNLTLLLLFDLISLTEFRVSMKPKNSLQNLKIIFINSCNALRFAYLGWPLPRLEVLAVVNCSHLKEIFKISGGIGIGFSALRIILVRECGVLKIICSDDVCFPSLQILEVRKCLRLKRLPRGVIKASKESLREIRGSPKWWNALTWDSEEDKMSLLPLFKAIDDSNL